ncbi:hypothetical protein PIB30_078688 [Stylosanthes scabra]|uniref:Putative plant transposon protein domain-containing protein n=1 Tax=Stylosanthes scabra TaxID=79078 RepID=A0ABU6ZPN4_9FABA|nr:hypothetical protein [Stylosanthes scabra]
MSSSSSYYHNEHLFRAPHHQEIYQKYIHRKGVTPEKSFELQEGQYPDVGEQIRLRGCGRLSKPRTKIRRDLVLEFYTNAVRTEEELASGEDYPYTSFVRGKETRQYEDQRLDEVIREICMPGAQWKMSSSQPPYPIQLRRQDLTPVARGWAEFIIHSMISTGNKSEITVARAVLIHSIIKGHDVRVEELIADNIAVLVEGVQGRSKLCFPSTIYRLCKEARVPMGEFKNTDQIQIARPITAKVMTTTRGRIINQPQNQLMEEDEDNYDAENLYTNHEQNQEMHYDAEMHYEAAKYKEQPNFEAYESNFQQYKEDQQQGFQFLNEELASMKIRQEQFFENMQMAQAQYLEELKSLRTRQNEMVNQQNNFYRQIKREQEKTIKEIEEVKKFQTPRRGRSNKEDDLAPRPQCLGVYPKRLGMNVSSSSSTNQFNTHAQAPSATPRRDQAAKQRSSIMTSHA